MLETREQQQMDPQHQAGDGLPPAVVKVRWKPNEEQLRMLVSLFEEEGDSINKQRIKEIAADLARQGEVTEANVHNWFHNRKARAKRKQKMIQMNDGESEVDTDDVDSKGKRTKLEQHHSQAVSVNGSGGFALPEFADQRAFMLRPSSLRLPSDAVNLSSRMFYESSMALPAHPSLQANECGGDKYKLSTEFSCQAETQAAADAWKSQALTLYTPSLNQRMPSPVDSMNRSSESKTITDDASTESEDMVDSGRRWMKSKKNSRKKGKGTMIRRPLERTGNGRSRHTSGRKTRIREVLKSLKRNSDNYDRDLKALFVEVVRRLGASRARSILSRITSRPESSSPSPSFDSGSRSSTASPVRQRVVSSSPNGYQWVAAAGEQQRFYNKVQTDLSRCTQQCCNRASYVAVVNNSMRTIASSTEDGDEDDSSFRGNAGGDEDETDVDKEDFRIVWSSQKKQDAEKLFTALSCEIKDEDATACRTNLVVQQEPATKKEKQPGTAVGAKPKLELAPEGEKTTIVLSDGKPTGPAGTWWNSMLRHSALLFLDISIPHIALQPEEGLMRIREYMDSKFEYTGGTLDDAYLKKQVAKSLNFRRHKVMRLIEQGAGRPSDVSEDQWDALIKYYADPKRREKSDKQRAALKALNMNNQLHQQQQLQMMQARQQQQQQQQQEQQQQQQQQQEAKHFVRDLNVQQVEEQDELGQVAAPREQDNEDSAPPKL